MHVHTHSVCTHEFLHMHTQTHTQTHTHYLMNSVSLSLIFNKRPVFVWYLLKLTLLYLQAIDLHSSVPPQDIHCFCSLYCSPTSSLRSGPVDITPRMVTFQDLFHFGTGFVKLHVLLQRWLCKSWTAGNSWEDASCGYYRLGKARVKLQRAIEAVQIKQMRTFILPFLLLICDAKPNKAEPRSAQVNLSRIPNCIRSSSGKTGSLKYIKRSNTHTHTHSSTHRQPCLGRWGARALIMSGTHERVAPHWKTNFTRLTTEPLSGHIVPRWIPSDSLSLNPAVPISQSGPGAGKPLGKRRPPRGLRNLVWRHV